MSNVGKNKGKTQFENFKRANEYITEMIEFVLQGYTYSEAHEYFSVSYNLSDEQIHYLNKVAKDEILKHGDFDLDMVIMQHVMYYEEMIKFFDQNSNYSAKAAAMGAKEKLLKIFEEKEPDIEIENNINIDVNQLSFNIKKLDAQEQSQFQSLFDKVKRIG